MPATFLAIPIRLSPHEAMLWTAQLPITVALGDWVVCDNGMLGAITLIQHHAPQPLPLLDGLPSPESPQSGLPVAGIAITVRWSSRSLGTGSEHPSPSIYLLHQPMTWVPAPEQTQWMGQVVHALHGAVGDVITPHRHWLGKALGWQLPTLVTAPTALEALGAALAWLDVGQPLGLLITDLPFAGPQGLDALLQQSGQWLGARDIHRLTLAQDVALPAHGLPLATWMALMQVDFPKQELQLAQRYLTQLLAQCAVPFTVADVMAVLDQQPAHVLQAPMRQWLGGLTQQSWLASSAQAWLSLDSLQGATPTVVSLADVPLRYRSAVVAQVMAQLTQLSQPGPVKPVLLAFQSPMQAILEGLERLVDSGANHGNLWFALPVEAASPGLLQGCPNQIKTYGAWQQATGPMMSPILPPLPVWVAEAALRERGFGVELEEAYRAVPEDWDAHGFSGSGEGSDEGLGYGLGYGPGYGSLSDDDTQADPFFEAETAAWDADTAPTNPPSMFDASIFYPEGDSGIPAVDKAIQALSEEADWEANVAALSEVPLETLAAIGEGVYAGLEAHGISDAFWEDAAEETPLASPPAPEGFPEEAARFSPPDTAEPEVPVWDVSQPELLIADPAPTDELLMGEASDTWIDEGATDALWTDADMSAHAPQSMPPVPLPNTEPVEPVPFEPMVDDVAETLADQNAFDDDALWDWDAPVSEAPSETQLETPAVVAQETDQSDWLTPQGYAQQPQARLMENTATWCFDTEGLLAAVNHDETNDDPAADWLSATTAIPEGSPVLTEWLHSPLGILPMSSSAGILPMTPPVGSVPTDAFADGGAIANTAPEVSPVIAPQVQPQPQPSESTVPQTSPESPRKRAPEVPVSNAAIAEALPFPRDDFEADTPSGLEALYGAPGMPIPPLMDNLSMPAEEPPIVAPPEHPARAYAEDDPRRNCTYTAGDVVQHPQFGQGVVERVIPLENRVTLRVQFEGVGKRLLDSEASGLSRAAAAQVG